MPECRHSGLPRRVHMHRTLLVMQRSSTCVAGVLDMHHNYPVADGVREDHRAAGERRAPTCTACWR